MSGHRARKRFGQHFLVDPGIVDAILGAVAAGTGDTLVEIGPGLGALTESLARSADRLHLVELDRDLAAALRERWRGDDRIVVHEGDALRFDFTTLGANLRIVGNLPYNISTPLLFHLLDQQEVVCDMHFMLQKEVVDRIVAAPGSKAYGRLTVMLQAYLATEPLFDVPPTAFDPPPAVNSAVVRLYPLPPGIERPRDRDALSALLASAFGQRRKTLRNALKGVVTPAELDAAGIDPADRAEAVPVDAWIRLSNRPLQGG